MSTPIRGRALVTGGTAGIGLAFATALAARGCDLLLVARDEERLRTTAAALAGRHGVDVQTMTADLSDRADTDRVAERLTAAEDPIEVLVNNAGHGLHDPIARHDLDVHLRALDVMVRAVLVLAGRGGATMKERGHGVIINVGSVAGLIAQNNYSAIKAWVNTFSDALALELEGSGVRVLTLLPGWVRTEFHGRAEIRTSSIPDFLWLDADRLVEDTLRAVDAGRYRVVPSRRFAVIAWLAQRLPRTIVRAATARLRRGAASR